MLQIKLQKQQLKLYDRLSKTEIIVGLHQFAVKFTSTIRRSHRCSVRKVVLRNFAKVTGKDLRQVLFSLKRDSYTGVFL